MWPFDLLYIFGFVLFCFFQNSMRLISCVQYYSSCILKSLDSWSHWSLTEEKVIASFTFKRASICNYLNKTHKIQTSRIPLFIVSNPRETYWEPSWTFLRIKNDLLWRLSLPLLPPTSEGLSSKSVTVMHPSQSPRKLLVQRVSLWSCFFTRVVWWSCTVKARENTVDCPLHPPTPPLHPPPLPRTPDWALNRIQECSELHIPAIAKESRPSRAHLTQKACRCESI